MRAVVWIFEDSWEQTIDAARAVLPSDAELVLLHVSPSDVEALVAGGARSLIGRHPPPPPGPPIRAIAEEEAQALLAAARERLGRAAETVSLRGRIEREVLGACADADLVVLARDGEQRAGPKSLGPRARFVVDHAPCQVLLVWPGPAPTLEQIRLPPHLR